MKKYRPFLIIAAVLALAVIGTVRLIRWERSRETFTAVSPTSSPTGLETKSSPSAVVTLEEFGDYQCPPCGALHPTLKKLKQEFGANLNFVFRNLPLATIHKNALAAAQAAEAARMQDRFWEMHDLLYENQDLWKDDINPRATFVKFAGDLGLDTTRFVRDLDDTQVQLRIDADQDAALKLGINGTPTILIDGRRLRDEATTPEGVRKGIEVMMAHRGSSEP
ncbi:MAG: thioredoxin domain-containing protein [Acidobacteriota bacterium]|nr:thioredoxin domain-containing protein [Acidobacteriota bacterium]